MRWRGAQWSGLSEAQRPPTTAEVLSREVVPFYSMMDSFKRTQQRPVASVWSREASSRTIPEQWGDRSHVAGMPRRIDGQGYVAGKRLQAIRRTRSASPLRSRSKSRSLSRTRTSEPQESPDAGMAERKLEPVRQSGTGKLPAPMTLKGPQGTGTPRAIKIGTSTAMEEWYKHKERELTGLGNDMEGLKAWSKAKHGRIDVSKRDPSLWQHIGTDRHMDNHIHWKSSRSASPRPRAKFVTSVPGAVPAAGWTADRCSPSPALTPRQSES